MGNHRRIYISGKISGLHEDEARNNFKTASDQLASEGWMPEEIINPFCIDQNDCITWGDFIVKDLAVLKKCTHIYMQDNWHNSAGATLEHDFAIRQGLKVIYSNPDGYNNSSYRAIQAFMDIHRSWADKTFGPDRKPTAPLYHLEKEVKEAIDAISQNEDRVRVCYEFADCMILLLHAIAMYGVSASELMHYVHNKFAIAQTRKWRPVGNGVFVHVKDEEVSNG